MYFLTGSITYSIPLVSTIKSLPFIYQLKNLYVNAKIQVYIIFSN